MADEPSRDRSHIYLPGHGAAQDYTAHRSGGSRDDLPVRDRRAHADQLTRALTNAVQAGEALLAQGVGAVAGGTPGLYLEFELPQGQVDIIDKLENKGGKFPITLASVRPLAGEKIGGDRLRPWKGSATII